MSKKVLVMLAVVGVIAAGCSKQQETTTTNTVSVPTQVQVDAQALKATAEEQAKVAAEQAQAIADQAKEEAASLANNAVDKVQDLLAQAQQLIDQGKLQEAIAMAQQVLNIDPANLDAKNIIETAKAKIASLAQEKAGDMKADMMNKVGSFGK